MGWTASWSHRTTLERDLGSSARVRDFVRARLVEHSLDELVDDVRLVASELATNALVHAQTPFSVTIAGDDRSVLLTVRDGSTVVPARRTAQVLATSGRGLAIVEQLSQRWGAETDAAGTKSVWAWFDGTPHAPRPTPW
jgi:anti-sigma regulatory factor (Ser/Thr protein kinase)